MDKLNYAVSESDLENSSQYFEVDDIKKDLTQVTIRVPFYSYEHIFSFI